MSTSRGTTLDRSTISQNTAISYQLLQNLDIVLWTSSSLFGPLQHRNEIQRLLVLDNLFGQDKSWLKIVTSQQVQKPLYRLQTSFLWGNVLPDNHNIPSKEKKSLPNPDQLLERDGIAHPFIP